MQRKYYYIFEVVLKLNLVFMLLWWNIDFDEFNFDKSKEKYVAVTFMLLNLKQLYVTFMH